MLDMTSGALTVRQLNFYVRSVIEGDVRLNNITVTGEISNFKNHYASGHYYFTLKDNDASIRCVMFRSFASRVAFTPEDGALVVLKGKVSLYEKDGQYQLYAEEMLNVGEGALELAFRQTKEKLEKEGLFDPATKRQIPKFPKSIAVVTSQTGAAVRDILNILSRRWSLSRIVLCPVAVQGDMAVPQMLDALDRLYALNSVDVIIIGRGGGSAEDLSAFNDESLARKVYESPVPIISAVGHETDFTICDFTADLRAPTPSAAAELAVPDIAEVKAVLERYRRILRNSLSAKLDLCNARFNACLNSPFFKNPTEQLVGQRLLSLDALSDKLNSSIKNYTETAKTRLCNCAVRLDGLSPLKIMARGYSSATAEGRALNSVKQIKVGDSLTLRLSDGSAECLVTDIKENDCD